MTERDAYGLCEEYGLLSPTYHLGLKRGGCWCCPFHKLTESQLIKETMPSVWAQYVSLEKEPAVAYQKWNPYFKETLEERDRKI